MAKVLPEISARFIRAAGNAIAPGKAGAGRLCVLNYHRILSVPDPFLDSEPDVAAFDWQMQLLKQCFNVLPLHEATHLLTTGRMPPRAVAISFDDGYRSIHDLAMPILVKHGLPATVFVTTGHMHDDGSMWNDMILEAVRRLPATPLELSALGLGAFPMAGPAERKQTAGALTELCKYMPLAERTRFTDYLQHLAGVNLRQDLMLTGDMLRTLMRNDIEIGGHTVNHPILTRLDDNMARREIVDNKTHLETMIGQPVRLFAYPNGRPGTDFDARHAAMVQDAGYDAAFTTVGCAATAANSRFEYPRRRPWDTTPLRFSMRLLRWLAGGQ
jgi:peptidoglycan/xylan/chitin deacetylase (PgdA/CDA1 family)